MNPLSPNLTGKFLIAMPDMSDERFSRSVIYICAHDSEGALGLIVNRPTDSVQLSALLDYMGIEMIPGAGQECVQTGGPVDPGRGFVLHSPEFKTHLGTMKVSEDIWMTASRDILEDVAQGRGPEQAFFALGYSGWEGGQLEDEIANHGWLVAEGSQDLIFSQAHAGKWTAALRGMGIEPALLSGSGGRA